MNNSKYDVQYQRQKDIKNVIYIDDNLIGFLDIGKQRGSQEDSLLMLKHPLSEAELLLIADGMGGLEHGEIASNMIAKELMDWFCNYDFELHDMNYLSSSYNEIIQYIDELLRSKISNAGSTLVSAICKDNQTLITNVGDSRCYIYDDCGLIQVTSDHNLAWGHFTDDGLRKDDLRYCIDNNLLTSRVGWKEKMLCIDSLILDNSLYNKLLLCSDGVTDVLPDSIIEFYLKNLDKNNIDRFIDYINSYREKKYNGKDDLFYDEIQGGKDNIAMIVKTNQKVRR